MNIRDGGTRNFLFFFFFKLKATKTADYIAPGRIKEQYKSGLNTTISKMSSIDRDNG